MTTGSENPFESPRELADDQVLRTKNASPQYAWFSEPRAMKLVTLYGYLASIALSFCMAFIIVIMGGVKASPTGVAFENDLDPAINGLLTTVYTIVSNLNGLVGTTAFVTLMIWIYASYRNLAVLGRPGRRYTPGRAVGFLFIPFYNLVVMYRVAVDLFRLSAPDSDFDQTQRKRGSGLIMGWYWITLCGWGVAYTNAIMMIFQKSTVGVPASIAAYSIGIFSNILLLLILTRIHERQLVRWAEVQQQKATTGDAL